MLPLDGVKVLDLSRVLAGPYATMLLADFGADVLKVEQTGCGDDTRHWGPPFAAGESAYFLSVNRNKRSLEADLKNPADRGRVLTLARDADVVIENFRRGTLESLGFGCDALQKDNPSLVYCSITGFGPGKDQDLPGYDFLVQARGGLMGITGAPEGEGMKAGVALSDVICGLHAANAILAALVRRRTTGEGARLEVPLFECQVASLVNRAQEFLVSGRDQGRLGNAHPTIVPYQAFPTADRPIAVAGGNDRQFREICIALDRADLADDPRYASNPGRVTNRAELVPILEAEFARRSSAHWIERLNARGVPCGPVNSLAEVFADEHFTSTGMRQTHDHAKAGSIPLLASPLFVDGKRLPIRRPPPALGQHNADAAWLESSRFNESDQ
jgi:crotonobetainyl-CoA:carnitine CoA-transferase CaiB-like acyl-CoA transferase